MQESFYIKENGNILGELHCVDYIWNGRLYKTADFSNTTSSFLRLLADNQRYELDDKCIQAFLSERIAPNTRENIGHIMHDNNMPYYSSSQMIKKFPTCARDDLVLECYETIEDPVGDNSNSDI